MIFLALLIAVASPSPTPAIHVSVWNQWVQPIYVYELDEPMSCRQHTFGGDVAYNRRDEPMRTVFADADLPGCSPHAKLYAGLPGSIEFDCWFNVDSDTLTNGPMAACTMRVVDGNDYEIDYKQVGEKDPP